MKLNRINNFIKINLKQHIIISHVIDCTTQSESSKKNCKSKS